jgi:hypothetical protein
MIFNTLFFAKDMMGWYEKGTDGGAERGGGVEDAQRQQRERMRRIVRATKLEKSKETIQMGVERL